MIRIYFLAFIVLPLLSYADSGINLDFNNKVLSQGSLQSAELTLDVETISKLDSKQISGTTISETLYFVEVSPFMRNKAGSYSALATVIFLKKPNEEVGALETAKGKVLVKWGPVEVLPTEAAETFLFGSFEIPKGNNFLTFVGVLIGILFLLIPFRRFYEKRKSNRAKKKQLDAFKKEILDAQNYESIVNVWKQKHDFLSVFPQAKDSFHKFEEVLFKVQFKPTQNDIEREQVVRAYKIFLDEIKGVLSGI